MTAWLLAVAPALAISDEEIFRDFPFNLTNPGARALALGGAFTSLADDSTAAQANPAGLVNLRRPELFFEVRSTRLDGSQTSVAGPLRSPSFEGEVSAGAASDPHSAIAPTFVSYVHPFGRTALAFSRLESLNVRTRTLNSFELVGTQTIFANDAAGPRPEPIGTIEVDYALTSDADVDVNVVHYNAAFAIEIARRLSLGLTAVIGQLQIDGRVDNTFVDRIAGPEDPFSYPTLDYATRIDDEDVRVAYNAGLLWKPWDWMSVGGTYRRGLRFEIEQRVLDLGVRANVAQKLYGGTFTSVMRTPDSYALGVALRPVEELTILVDAVRVEYQDLLDGYAAGLNRLTFPNADTPFTVDDGTEVRAGIEWIVLIGKTPLALRAGAWSDPDRRIRYDGTDEGIRQVFPEGERVTHYTAGVGMTLNQSIQLDVAADVSNRSTNIVLSSIYRF